MWKMGQKWTRNRFFLNSLENLAITFFWIWSITKVYSICCIKSHIWEKSVSWDMGQNDLSQSNCRNFKSTIPLTNRWRCLFFACWYIFMEIKSWLTNIGVGMVKNECDCFGCRTALVTAIKGITDFWLVDINSGKLKVSVIIFGWWWSNIGTAFFL